MKKLLCAIALLLLVGCGSAPPTNTAEVPPPSDTPTITITANPDFINEGDNTTLTWTSTNATRVEITGLPGASSPSGVVTVSPTRTTTYTATAYGVRSQLAATKVTVFTLLVPPPPPPPPPPIIPISFTVSWSLPTTYTDNTAIDNAAIATLRVHLYMKTTNAPFLDTDIPIATSTPGATSLTYGPTDINFGATYYFSCKAFLPTGEISAFGPLYAHIFYY